MNRQMRALICWALVFALSGCGAESVRVQDGPAAEEAKEADGPAAVETETAKSIEPTQEQGDRDAPLDVMMWAVEGAYDHRTATFELKNSSQQVYTYSPAYGLEKRIDYEWRETELAEPLVWNAVAYTLEPETSVRFQVDWSFGYGELGEGTYRLRKSVCDEKGERTEVYAVFELGETSAAEEANP